MWFLKIISFSSYVLAFTLWNFISVYRLTLCFQKERSGFSAKLNSFDFIVCYETAADTRKMPSHHWTWGVQKKQEKNDCSSLSALALFSFLSVFSFHCREEQENNILQLRIPLSWRKEQMGDVCSPSWKNLSGVGGLDSGSGIERGGWRDEVRAVCWIYC